jgi:hypothetical protein
MKYSITTQDVKATAHGIIGVSDTEAVYDYTNKADALKRLVRMVRGNKRVTPDNDHKYYNRPLLAVTVWNNEADEVVKEVVIYEG